MISDFYTIVTRNQNGEKQQEIILDNENRYIELKLFSSEGEKLLQHVKMGNETKDLEIKIYDEAPGNIKLRTGDSLIKLTPNTIIIKSPAVYAQPPGSTDDYD